MHSLSLYVPAALLAGFGVLLAISVLFSRAGARIGLPLTLVFLSIGMLAGSEGLGNIAFDDYRSAFALGTVALAFILFDGGLNTHWAAVRQVLAPGALLATIGVVATASLMAVGGHLLGLDWNEAWLIGAIVSSTDAASVFAVLRAADVNLKKKVGTTLELESGLNDPVAFIMTGVVIQVVRAPGTLQPMSAVGSVVLQLVVGLAGGVLMGIGARRVLRAFPVQPSGLVPAFTIAVACLGFGFPALLGGSGFLAVYAAGIALGAGAIPFRSSVQRVHDSLAWLSQIGMFLMLGLLSFPTRIAQAVPIGIGLAVVLAVLARPAAVALCLAPFGYRAREIGFVGWVGLRGAVPIVLATLPVLAQVPGAERAFDVVFVIVVANALLQGTTVPWLARRLHLESGEAPPPPAMLEIEGPLPFDTAIRSFHVDEDLPVCFSRIADVPFPTSSSVMLVIRGRSLISPNGELVLLPADHVYLLVGAGDDAYLQLLFGRPDGK